MQKNLSAVLDRLRRPFIDAPGDTGSASQEAPVRLAQAASEPITDTPGRLQTAASDAPATGQPVDSPSLPQAATGSPGVFTATLPASSGLGWGWYLAGGLGAAATATGNNSGGSSTAPDRTPPTVTITDRLVDTATGDITFTFTFDEAISGFAAADIVVANGSKGAFTAISDRVYTLPVSPTPNASGTLSVNVSAGAATDPAGNPSLAATPVNRPYIDLTPPALQITDNVAGIATGSVNYTFVFSEPVSGFGADDIAVSNGFLSNFRPDNTDPASYTATVTPNFGANGRASGTLQIAVSAAAARDAGGNSSLAAASTQAFDNVAPTLTSITDNAQGATAASLSFTVTFSEPVSGFTREDVIVSGGTTGTLTGSGSSYLLTVTPPANSTSPISISVPAGAAVDLAGNATTNAMSWSSAMNVAGAVGIGRVITGVAGDSVTPRGYTVLDDGKILVVGSVYSSSSDYNYAFARYQPDGSLDTTFAGAGTVSTDFAGGYDMPTDHMLQSDGRLLVVGSAYSSSNGTDNFALTRYNIDGSLDPGFGRDGTVSTDISGGHDTATGYTRQSDGNLLVVGATRSLDGRNTGFALARYDADGNPDTSFAGDGTVNTGFGFFLSRPIGHTVQSDGKILVVGYAASSTVGNYNFALARYNADGSLDTSFAGDGTVNTDFAGGNDTPIGYTVQSDGKILVVGSAASAIYGYFNFALARYNADGSLDTTFSGDGTLSTDFAGYDDRPTGFTLQNDGRILVVGSAGTSYDGQANFALARYNADGSPDTTFSGDGTQTTDFAGYDDKPTGYTLQSDGKILVVGEASTSNNEYIYNFALARYNADGSIDTSFGHPVKATFSPTTGASLIDDAPTISGFTDGSDHFALSSLSYGQLTIADGSGPEAGSAIIRSGSQYLAVVMGMSAANLTALDFVVI